MLHVNSTTLAAIYKTMKENPNITFEALTKQFCADSDPFKDKVYLRYFFDGSPNGPTIDQHYVFEKKEYQIMKKWYLEGERPLDFFEPAGKHTSISLDWDEVVTHVSESPQTIADLVCRLEFADVLVRNRAPNQFNDIPNEQK